MREILFRGKRLDNGEWITGNLFVSDTDGRTYRNWSVFQRNQDQT